MPPSLVRLEQVDPGAIFPTKATPGSACYDLYYPTTQPTLDFNEGEIKIVSTGFKIALPPRVVGFVLSRSGLASKGLVVGNSPGVIDSDYRGELKVILRRERISYGDSVARIIRIHPGDRVGQLYIAPDFSDVFSLKHATSLPTNTDRGEGGFGSTGS